MSGKPELFAIPEDGGYILYAPLRRLIARVNASAKEAVARELCGAPLDDDDLVAVKLLRGHGFFEPSPPPRIPETFRPVHVTLFPTDACNLRCRYCYAAAAEGAKKLPMAAARAAVDLVAQNAKELGRDNFLIGFHGNGEPFMGFDVMREVCEYADGVSKKLGVKAVFNTATNGVLSEKQLDFLLCWFTNVNVSFDILPELQNRQRPFPDGSGSFPVVDATLRRLDKAGICYGIRATVTAASVHRLVEMAEYVKEHYPGCSQLHLEPAWEIGRAVDTGEKTPVASIFVEQYLEALSRMGPQGLKLVYSGARQDLLAASFCSVCRGSFTVTADANVTSCYEVCTNDDPRAGRFLFGRFDFDAGKFVFDEEKMDALAHLQVGNMLHCADCFCKWHCAGDCAAKLLGTADPGEHAGSARCEINRALTLRQIQRKLRTDEGGTSHGQ